MTPDFNVLILSVGRRVGLVQIWQRTLRQMGLAGRILATDVSTYSSALQIADQGFLVPPCSDPDFVEHIVELCRTHDVQLLIPRIDAELSLLATHREDFAKVGTVVAVSSPETVTIGCDKEATHRWLLEQGFPTVRQTTAEDLLVGTNGWKFPLLIKPTAGNSSIGVEIVADRAQLERATQAGDFVVQTIAPGTEYTIDILASREGRCLCAVPRKRIEVRAGESSKGVTVRHAEIEDLAHRFCDALPGAFGPLNLQVFVDQSTGEVNVIEMNPRFGGGFPLSWEAGAVYPQWMIEELLGLPSSSSQESWRDGLVMLRWDDAVYVDSAQLSATAPSDFGERITT